MFRRSGDTTPCGPISPYSGRDCVKSLRSSYTGLYPQTLPPEHQPKSVVVFSSKLNRRVKQYIHHPTCTF